MKAPAFDYACPADLEEALALLEEYGPDAQILAGGQSLVPSLNFRLSTPSLLIDINRIATLSGIERRADNAGDVIRIGALTRHVEIERSAIIREALPLLTEAMEHVAHPAIRTRGTFGGSLCLADPAAELPACAVALGAALVLASRGCERTIEARDFFKGLFETDLQPGEILREILLPVRRAGQAHAFLELSRRHGDYAVAGIAASLDRDGDKVADLRLVVFGCESHPRIARFAAAAAEGQRLGPDLVEAVAQAVAGDLSCLGENEEDRSAKLHLAQVLARRAMARLISDLQDEAGST